MIKRPPCPRCGGFIIKTNERDRARCRVIKCLLCGWRVYPECLAMGENLEGIAELLLQIFYPGSVDSYDSNPEKKQKVRR